MSITSSYISGMYYIIRNENVEGQFIDADAEQARLITAYYERYKAGLGREPVGLHWLPEIKEFVLLSPTEQIIEGE